MGFRYWIWLGLCLVWLGCSAPHDNSLDPDSSHYLPPPPDTTAVLNALIRSVHISRINLSRDSYSVVAELSGSDASSQDTAWITFDGQPRIELSWVPGTGWSALFAASYFGDPQLGSVVGKPFIFSSIDRNGISHTIGPAYMWRVIDGVPLVISPAGDSTITTNPTFIWQSFEANFPFNYEVNLVNTTDGFETIIWTSPMVTDTVLDFPDVLSDGNYYWTVTVEDSFENSSRSKEGQFIMQSGLTPQRSPLDHIAAP